MALAAGMHCIKSFSRHRWLTNSVTKCTNFGKCSVSRTGMQRMQLLSSIRCTPVSPLSTSSSSVVSTNKLFHNNRGHAKFIAVGAACGIGIGVMLSSIQGVRCLMSALAAEPSDPTTTESGWLPKTEEVYMKLLARVEAGELKLLRTTKVPVDRVVYSLSHPQKGAHFEYGVFLEEASQKGIAVIQFGPQTQGPPGYVHGGATATMFDTVTAVFLHKAFEKTCVTANLNINLRRPIPLNSTVLAETWVEKIEGRKHVLRCEMKSTEGQLLVEGTALWISVLKP